MARSLFWMIAKSLAAIVGAYAGYFAGFALSYIPWRSWGRWECVHSGTYNPLRNDLVRLIGVV